MTNEEVYLYHRIPNDMEGDVLYPLNVLKESMPEVYKMHAKKYEGREELMERTVPILNCKWNDVLHLSSVHPQVVHEHLQKIGSPGLSGKRFLCIDPRAFEPLRTVVFLYESGNVDQSTIDTEVVPYDYSRVGEYSVFPKVTEEYYAEESAAGRKPLIWHRIPHILYKGSIRIDQHSILVV